MTIQHLRGVFCGAAAVALAFIGGTAPLRAMEMSPELKKIVDGARTESTLTIEAPPALLGGPDAVAAATDWMKREFGITVRGNFTPNPYFPVLIAKIYTEMQAQQKSSTDAFIGAANSIQPMLDRGLFREIAWQTLLPGRINSGIAEEKGKALRILSRFPGVLYNKQQLPEIAQVNSMYDLLKPEFHGKLTTNPFLNGFEVLIANWGHDKVTEYVTKFSTQISGLVQCGSGERIASGEILALALDCAGVEQTQPRFKDLLGLQIVPDSAQRQYLYLTIPTNAANPNTGILYGLFFSTPEGQAWLRNRNNGDLDIYPESTQRGKVADAEKKGIKFTNFDLDWAAKNSAVFPQMSGLIGLIQKK